MKYLYMFLALCFIGIQVAYAAETEPNNAAAQANTLSANGSNTGKVGTAGDVDWWKVTIADGKLNVKIAPVLRKGLWLYLYDNNGTTVLSSANDDSAFTQSVDGLAAGTYYLKVVAVKTTDTANYAISNTVNSPTQANDTEPNNSRTQAVVLATNTTKTGHVGYYYNLKRDTSDWYKVTTTGNNKLKLKLTPANGHYISVSLYASNGSSLIGSASGNAAFSLLTAALRKDIYYIKVNAKTNSDFAPYTLTDSLLTASATDSFTLAVDYAYRNKISSAGKADWWRVSPAKDGKLTFTLTPVSGKFVWVYLYDRDRTTLLNSSYSNVKFSQATDGLAAGTYFVKIVPYYNTDTATYVLADTLTTPAQANDTEPNGTKAQALTLTLNGSKTGHVGYYYDKKRDTADWYKITTTGDGILKLNLTPANGQYAWIYLYDNNGTTLLNSTYSNAAFSLSTDGLAAGTYYVRVNCYYNTGFTPYTLSNTLTKPAQANDVEPNDAKAQAVTLPVNSTKTGHVGYYYNNKRDTADWYKITTASDGKLDLKATTANNQYIWVYLYDNDGTTLLNSNYTNTNFVLSTDGLAPGTYYVRVNCYYNTGFAPYTLTDSLSTYGSVTEVEPNKKPYQATAIANNTSGKGHVGFYYKKTRDTLDWWKISYTGSGSLQFGFNISAKKSGGIPYLWFYVYKDTSASPIYSSYFNSASNVISLSSLSKTTYYIKIIPYYNTDFTAYSISYPSGAPLTMAQPLYDRIVTEQTLSNSAVAVYPNPAAGQLHVTMPGKDVGVRALILRDATGKQVWSAGNPRLVTQGSTLHVDVSRMAAGIYYITITDKTGNVTTQKVVIAR